MRKLPRSMKSIRRTSANWRAVALEGLPGLFEKQDSTAELRRAHEQQLTELYAEIGKLTTQVGWLKKSYNSDEGGTSRAG